MCSTFMLLVMWKTAVKISAKCLLSVGSKGMMQCTSNQGIVMGRRKLPQLLLCEDLHASDEEGVFLNVINLYHRIILNRK